MLHGNVVVNLHEHGFKRAFKLLQGQFETGDEQQLVPCN